LNTAGPTVSETEMAENFAAGGFRLEPFDEVDLGERERAPAPAPPASRAPTDDEVRIFYFTLRTPDLDASVAFFAELFGWRIEPGGSGGGHIANTIPPGGLAGATGAGVDLYFRVPDFRATVARVRALGGVVDEPVRY